MIDKSNILLVGDPLSSEIDWTKFPYAVVQVVDFDEAGQAAARDSYMCCLVFDAVALPEPGQATWPHDVPLLVMGGDRTEGAYAYGAVDVIATPCPWRVLENKLGYYDRVHRQRRLLTEANARLEDMNARIKKFVGNLAHDLRGPLGKLINTSEILLAGVEQESLKTFYNILVRTSRRGFDLVNDLLDLNALESGQIKMAMERCDLAELAEQVTTEMTWQAAEKEIDLINRIHQSQEVQADSSRLFQVLTNLIGNAIKFTPRSGTIELVAEATPKGILLEVRDTGVGMPPEAMCNLFEVHKRVTTPGTEGEKGTGLGLALAQEIVRRHGSEITVNSQPGKGSCFSLLLPAWKLAQAKVN